MRDVLAAIVDIFSEDTHVWPVDRSARSSAATGVTINPSSVT